MSYTPLNYNFKNDILDESNTNVKYAMTENGDGTISLQDVSVYEQYGDSFDASTLNEIGDAIDALGTDLDSVHTTLAGLLDLFYPVGSYYETSDEDFDPNVDWGGVWSLETEGQVHVSSGANYPVSGAATNVTDGGATTVTLTAEQMPSHCHSPNSTGEYFVTNEKASANNTRVAYSASGNRMVDGLTDTDTSSFHHTSTTTATGGSEAHNNMQPYIVVHRWHRTG